jgi:hypothetical protein
MIHPTPLLALNQAPAPKRGTPPFAMTCPVCESLSIVRGEPYHCLGCQAEFSMTPVSDA